MNLDEERLAGLLRRLPPPPVGWIRAAQELPSLRSVLDELVTRAEEDAELRASILADLEAALAAEGIEPSPSVVRELRSRLEAH
jgi:hypothetical protein